MFFFQYPSFSVHIQIHILCFASCLRSHCLFPGGEDVGDSCCDVWYLLAATSYVYTHFRLLPSHSYASLL